LAILRDDDPRFQHLARKIGIFVIVAVAGVVFTIAAIGFRQDVFTARTHIHFIAATGENLVRGMPVKLSGFEIGKLESLALTEQAAVRVNLAVKSNYMKWVRRDSRARLARESLIGDAVVEIVPGTPQAAELAEGEQISFDPEMGMSRVVDQLYAEVVPLIHDVRRIARYLDDPNGDFKQTVKRSNELLASTNTMIGNTNQLIVSLQGTRERLDTLIASMQRELPPTIKSGRETLEGGKKVVDSLQRTWPISSNIEPPKAGMLPLDSSAARPPAK
jgi:phospholipid/cholesterol/gamma-HCH transport system substrate-binding protein